MYRYLLELSIRVLYIFLKYLQVLAISYHFTYSVEYILMCVLTTIFFWTKYFTQSEICFTVFQISVFLFIQFIVIFLVAYVTIGYTVSEKKKPSIIPNWEKVKEELK